MPHRRIKLSRKDDIASVVKQIRMLKDREIIFELESGSALLRSSDTLKLLKRTGEALGKKVLVETEDEVGKILAKKAGILVGDAPMHMPKQTPTQIRVARSDIKPKFSDIPAGRRILTQAKPSVKKSPKLDRVLGAGKEITQVVTDRIPSRVPKKYFWILAILVLGFFAVAVLLPQATITVLARSEPVSRDLEIAVDTKTASVDPSRLTVPGVAVTREVSQTKNFPTSGTSAAGEKSTGTVQLYNFTPYTLTLKAATTTLQADGKKYFFTKDVTGIRATVRTGSQINESTTTGPIEIVAELPGDSYNLPANTRFQIINQALGNQEVYAINKTALTGGGSVNTTKALSAEDIEKARTALTDEILVEAEADLAAETGKPMKVLRTGVQQEILADTTNKEVGTETDNFDMTLIARVTGIAFSETDVTSLVETKINEVLSDDKYLVDGADSHYTATFKSLDLASGRGVLSVHFETVAAYKLDNSDLTDILAGKTEPEIREIMLSKPEVDSIEVEFWPAWMVHKAPRWNGRINIETVLSK